MSHFIVSCAPGEPARAPGTHETSRNAGNEDYFACRCPSFRPPDNDRAHSQAKHAVQLGGRDESSLVERVPEVLSWITWQEVGSVVTKQRGIFCSDNPSVNATLSRLADSLTDSIARHS